MQRARSVLITIGSGLLFGLSVASVDPAPHALADYFFVVAFGAYVAAGLMVRSPGAHRALVRFGLITFVCFAVANSWYWYGAFQRGWWYPPQIPWVQLFYYIDGEASYDAAASNLFISIWLVASAAVWFQFARHDPQPLGRAA